FRSVDLLPVRDGAAEDAEERELADVRLRVRLEDERGERAVILALELDDLVEPRPLRDLAHRLSRIRQQVDQPGEQRARGPGLLRGAAEDREQLAAQHGR